MENTNYKPIKFHGNPFFFAVLLFCELNKKYYFAFSKISSIVYKDGTKEKWVKNKAGNPLYCFSNYNMELELSGEYFDSFDFDKHIIPIDPSDFNILCKLLECIYND